MSSQTNQSDSGRPVEEKISTTKELLNKIRLAVDAGDFLAAEKLRDKLIETNPMAISEAIKTAEMIEDGMSAAIDKDHLAIWPELYDQLTVEERNCLFHSMKKYALPEGKVLLKYGTLNNRLFFIEKGRVIIGLPQKENKLKVFAQLGRGDILGEYTFATIALCSATAITKTEVQLRCLVGSETESWDEKHPGLQNRILEYCHKYGRVDQILERKEQENHVHPRHSVQGRVKAILLNNNGLETKATFHGDLGEISRSGTSFSIQCNKKAIVKQLLTRSFSLTFTLGQKGKEINFSTMGRVVRVTSLLYNDYILHVGFHSTLPVELDAKLAPRSGPSI